MATSPAPDAAAPPGMCPGTALLGAGGAGGGGSGGVGGGGNGSGGGGKGGGKGGKGDGKNAQGAPDYAKYPECGYASHPVDVVTGRAFTHPITDLELPGPLPLRFRRMYSSKMAARDVGLGYGWGHTFGWEIEVGRQRIRVWNEQGIAVDFSMMAVGAEVVGPWGWLLRREASKFALDADDGVWRLFSPTDERGHRYRLAVIRDRNGNAITPTYKDGRLSQVIDSAGRVIRVRSSPEKRIASLEVQNAVAEGKWIAFATYAYDERGDLVSAQDADGFSAHYAYDDEHRLAADTDRTGLCFHFVYDREGRCVESWGDYPGKRDPSLIEELPKRLADGVTRVKGIHHCRFDYMPNGYSEVADSTQVRKYFGNEHGTLDKKVEDRGVMTATYREDGHILSRTDPMEATATFERDQRGRLVKLIDPLGRVTAVERDGDGLPVALTDPAGGIVKLERDARGNLILVSDPAGSVSTFRRDERGLLTGVVSPTGVKRTFAYDAYGNLVLITGPTGGLWRFAYDALGRRLSRTDPLGAETQYGYSPRGDLISVRDPLGRVTRYTYDGEAHLTQIVSPQGRVTSLTWGGYHKLCARKDANGHDVYLRYNTEGELVEVHNERGEIHRLTYSGNGFVIRETTVDGRDLRFRRDLCGRVIWLVNGLREITEIEYDLAGQVVKRKFDDGASEEFSYDPRGELIRAKGPGGEFRFERDEVGRIVREVQIVGSKEHSVTTIYDPAGRRVGRKTSLGHSEVVTRGALGERARTVLDGDHVVHHRADILGREIARALPAGGWLQSTYDAMGSATRRRAGGTEDRCAEAAGGPEWIGERADGATVDMAYRYDRDGELIESADRARGSIRYEYDPIGQLLAMVPEKVRAELFRYDAAGNLYESGGETEAREYGKGNRLLRKGDTEYRWDGDGRLVEKRTLDRASGSHAVWVYRWDCAGLLKRVDGPGGTQVEFAYDPFARRMQKRVTKPSQASLGRDVVSVMRFVWDGDVLVHEINTAARDGGDPAIEERTYCFEDDGFEPMAHLEKGEWFHYVNDPIGTPERLLEAQGDVACELRRGAWGTTEAAPGGRASTSLRFQGQYEDEETGLCYNRWRYYDADTGSFTSPDPKGLAAGLRAFGYGPNPVTWVDPLGLALWEAFRVEKGGGIRKGKKISEEEAINRMGNEKHYDVYADTRAEAESLAIAANKENGRTCKPLYHPAHRTGKPRALPHIHPDDHKSEFHDSPHIFFPDPKDPSLTP